MGMVVMFLNPFVIYGDIDYIHILAYMDVSKRDLFSPSYVMELLASW